MVVVSMATGRRLWRLRGKKLPTEEQIAEILDPKKMTEPRKNMGP
jgi:hypothetical protein